MSLHIPFLTIFLRLTLVHIHTEGKHTIGELLEQFLKVNSYESSLQGDFFLRAEEEYRKRKGKEKKFVPSDLWDHYFKCVLHDWISKLYTGYCCIMQTPMQTTLILQISSPQFLSEYGIMFVCRKPSKCHCNVLFRSALI